MTEDVDEYTTVTNAVITANLKRLDKVTRGVPSPFVNMTLGTDDNHATYSGFMKLPNMIWFIELHKPQAKIFSYTSNTTIGEILEELAEG